MREVEFSNKEQLLTILTEDNEVITLQFDDILDNDTYWYIENGYIYTLRDVLNEYIKNNSKLKEPKDIPLDTMLQIIEFITVNYHQSIIRKGVNA